MDENIMKTCEKTDEKATPSKDEFADLQKRLKQQEQLVRDLLAQKQRSGTMDSVIYDEDEEATEKPTAEQVPGCIKVELEPTSTIETSDNNNSNSNGSSVNESVPSGLSDEQLARWYQDQEETLQREQLVQASQNQQIREPTIATLQQPNRVEIPSQVLSDEQYAKMLQRLELDDGPTFEYETADVGDSLVDPVWGALGTTNPKPHQVICFSMCPCLVGSCCSSERKAVYRKLSRSMTFFIMLVQILLFLFSLTDDGLAPTNVNPMIGPYADTLNDMGAKNSAEIVYNDEYWRLLTPMFLHAGLIHLVMNVIVQMRIGVYLEFDWGLKYFIPIYFGSGLISSLLSAVFIPDSIGVGSSGAICGLLGAWLVHMLVQWGDGSQEEQGKRAFQLVLCFINVVIVLGFSLVPMIDWAAHAGGLIGGFSIALLLFSHTVTRRSMRIKAQILGIVLCIALCVVPLYLLASGDIDPDRKLLDVCALAKQDDSSHNC